MKNTMILKNFGGIPDSTRDFIDNHCYYLKFRIKNEKQKGNYMQVELMECSIQEWQRITLLYDYGRDTIKLMKRIYGTDLRYIQELLGHKSSKTTEIYTHVTRAAKNKIVSPLDNLNLNEEKKLH